MSSIVYSVLVLEILWARIIHRSINVTTIIQWIRVAQPSVNQHSAIQNKASLTYVLQVIVSPIEYPTWPPFQSKKSERLTMCEVLHSVSLDHHEKCSRDFNIPNKIQYILQFPSINWRSIKPVGKKERLLGVYSPKCPDICPVGTHLSQWCSPWGCSPRSQSVSHMYRLSDRRMVVSRLWKLLPFRVSMWLSML